MLKAVGAGPTADGVGEDEPAALALVPEAAAAEGGHPSHIRTVRPAAPAVADAEPEPPRPSRVDALLWRARAAALQLAPIVFVGFVLSAAAAKPIAADPAVPRSAHRPLRKAPVELDPSGGVELMTLATLFNIHTGEAFALSDDEPAAPRFSDSLADRATGARIELDPRLLDLLRRIARRSPGARIELVSGFRSPKLNEMLRKKGHNVASHSQHSLGHACDFRIVGLTPAEMKAEIQALAWPGGIGRYDKRSDWFVHADVGPKREWYGGR